LAVAFGRVVRLPGIVSLAFFCARYMTLEIIAPLSDDPIVGMPALAA
jgi:hypothetical protein